MLTNEVRSSFGTHRASEPVRHRLLDRVTLSSSQASVQLGVQRVELVLDLGPRRAADLLADPLAVRVETKQDHPAPAPSAGLVMGAVPAVRPAIKVDTVFAVATARSPSYTRSLRLGSHNGSQPKSQKIEQGI
jgi:hypothetical protein